ncbi:MAG: 2-hydroxyglutaryl-CoA dehydratase [Dehalococcoidia bacterium]|nr:MAG: 2-hydroxyglutaryl-CoA dehydratase [Dehalococcoidia bacterium]
MKALGIDVGSLTIKVAVLSSNDLLSFTVTPSGDDLELSAKAALAKALGQPELNLDNNLYLVSTGIGGKLLKFSRQQKAITTCLARGVHFLFPSARTAIDIGAETCNVIRVNERGRINDWVNHDKCAAGTGVFLQKMAKIMRMPLEEMSELSFHANSRPEITSTCAVFAESEVISHVHRDPPTPKEEIVAGIYSSVVSRIMTLCKRIGIEKDVAVVGGVALNRGLVNTLEKEIGFKVLVPDAPQIAASLGAAVIARDNMGNGADK